MVQWGRFAVREKLTKSFEKSEDSQDTLGFKDQENLCGKEMTFEQELEDQHQRLSWAPVTDLTYRIVQEIQ